MGKAQPGSMRGWGSWGDASHPGVSMVLATALAIVYFILEIYHVKGEQSSTANPNDLLAAAGFTLTAWTFILMFFGNDWRFTFKLHALLSFAVTLTFAILSAEENADFAKTAAGVQALSLAACILAWCAVVCLTHVLYVCFWNMFQKRWEKKDYAWFATVLCFFLTVIAFILWLNSGTVSMTPLMSNWVHGLFIAGTCFALVACISYIFGLIEDGDLLDLYSGIACIALTIFWIASVAITPDNQENTVFLAAVILTAFNTVVLAYLAFSVIKKFWAQSWSGRILVITVVLVVIQYTLAMTAEQPNGGAIQPTPVVTRSNWWLGILSAGFSCAIAACFFSIIKQHLPTSLNFNAAALALYVTYFVTECHNRTKNNVASTNLYDFSHRKGIAALVLCSAIIVLLLVSLILKALTYKGKNAGDTSEPKQKLKIICRSCCYTQVVNVDDADETGVPGPVRN